MKTLAGRAFAKVNLGLRILDRRPDGFHELRTVFQTISLADRVRVGWKQAKQTKIELTCSDPELENPDNLAWRAADALLRLTGRTGRVHVQIDKRVPAGAGLGGGSSDAGAVLRALGLLLSATPAELQWEAAETLGSDVPFFLQGGRAVGLGRGEELYPLPEQKRQWMILATPDVHVSTAEAYRALAASRSALTPDRKGFILRGFCAGFRASSRADGNELAGALTNDFEDIVFQQFPKLERVKQELLRIGAKQALMSGSGSALFGVFEDRAAAVRAYAKVEGRDWTAQVVRTISRGEFGRWKQAEQKS
ncbi:MAG: 4-(cytidine 5'-diphospho)-2-C-methyl-D-erythritol kinase [Bryobacterales bacterium]